ncbi:uncharacterized protein LOC111391027 [Olea europaea var. sylvestris]|uniref:uncharacterized protein LOC111391027 n=1 Tax=Olea europaea var. sylvestris TaxID=158386 RepID=UPI000C1CFEA0|nr:uncharacterized protein LOC111391027 [Olea europaea var. sylvestris]
MCKLDLMMEKMGQAGEEKGQAATLPELDEIWTITLQSDEGGAIIDSHNSVEESGKVVARNCGLKMLVSKGIATPLSAIFEAMDGDCSTGLRSVKVREPGLGFIGELVQHVEDKNELVKQAQMSYSPNRNKNNSSSPNFFKGPSLYLYTHPNISTHSIQIIHPKTNVVTVLQPSAMPSEFPVVGSTGHGVSLDMILAIIACLIKSSHFKELKCPVFAKQMVWLHDELTKTSTTSTLRTRWILGRRVMIDLPTLHVYKKRKE